MTNAKNVSNTKLLKKLRKKAEQCRYAHSMLKEKYGACQKWKAFSITGLSLFSSTVIGAHYRGLIQGEWWQFCIFLIALLIVGLQSLDHTVFCWTQKSVAHEAAVQSWGAWIREADFLEKTISGCPLDVANEKMQSTQEKYIGCMQSTVQIPTKKFLKYKMDFKEFLLKSQKIDSMTLEDIANEKKCGRAKNKKK